MNGTRRPFTVVVCTACAADDGPTALDALRATVRRCDHGVLVTAGCLVGLNACIDARGHECLTVAVQSCTIDRRPLGRVTWLGPIRRPSDVRAVCRSLERGDWDVEPRAGSRN